MQSLPLGVKLDHTNDGKDPRMGNRDNDTLVPFQKT